MFPSSVISNRSPTTTNTWHEFSRVQWVGQATLWKIYAQYDVKRPISWLLGRAGWQIAFLWLPQCWWKMNSIQQNRCAGLPCHITSIGQTQSYWLWLQDVIVCMSLLTAQDQLRCLMRIKLMHEVELEYHEIQFLYLKDEFQFHLIEPEPE